MTHLRAIFSIHDVMPRTLEATQGVIATMNMAELPPADLLVCPGTGWDEESLVQLRQWENGGHRLAGHGWSHTVKSISGVKHRLHSALISRRAAEHLSLTCHECRELMESCHLWFSGNGFRPPDLYVPPAWAMGPVEREQLRQLPFRFYEMLTGIYDRNSDCFHRLPVVGFQADTPGRVFNLRILNALNLATARFTGRPLRVAIHPFDLEYRLANSLRRWLRKPLCSVRVSVLGDTAG